MADDISEQRRRGRPERSDAARAEMRAKIEAAALKLFQTEGYGAVSMRRLAREAGCSPMTLYGYFENKIDILRALWAQVFIDLFDGLAPQISAAASPSERLRILAQGYVDYWLRHPDHYRMVFMAEGVSQPDVSGFLNDGDVVVRFGAFYETLEAASAQALTPEDVKAKGDLFLSALHGIAHCQITISGFDWTPADTQVAALVERLTG